MPVETSYARWVILLLIQQSICLDARMRPKYTERITRPEDGMAEIGGGGHLGGSVTVNGRQD